MRSIALFLVLVVASTANAQVQLTWRPTHLAVKPRLTFPTDYRVSLPYRVEDNVLMCRALEVAEAKARTVAAYWDNLVSEDKVLAYLRDLTTARKAACRPDWTALKVAFQRLAVSETDMVRQFGLTRGLTTGQPIGKTRNLFYSLTAAVLGSAAHSCGGGSYERGIVDYVFARSSAPIDFSGRPNTNTSARGVASMSIDAKYDGDIPRADFCPPIKLPDGAPSGRSPATPPSSRGILAALNAVPASSAGCYQATGAAHDCSPIATGPDPQPKPDNDDKEMSREVVVHTTLNEDGSYYVTTAGPVTVETTNATSNNGPNFTTGETLTVVGAVAAIVQGVGTINEIPMTGNGATIVGTAMAIMAAVIVAVDTVCGKADCSGINVPVPGMMMCPLFRAGQNSDPVFIRSPTGAAGLTLTDSFNACACNAGARLGACTADALTRNQCYFDPLVSRGTGALATETCVSTVYTDNPWLNKPAIRDGYCYVLDCPAGQEPRAGSGGCSCASYGASGPALPSNWNICLAAMCPVSGEGCLCM